jgi:hypothetical protein
VKPDRALEVLFSRWFNVTYGTVMCLAFMGVALWGYNEGSAQLIWVFGSGVHAGIAFMWVISPRVTQKWREEMRAELDKITEECLQKMHEHIRAEFPSPTISPHEPHERMH